MRRTTIFALVVLNLLSQAPALAQTQPPYDVVRFETNLMIPMRDGVRLATDVYRPAIDASR